MENKSIYEKILGADFQRLHPALQKRYDLKTNQQLIAKGTMHHIQGGPKWLYPLWLLGTTCKFVFPESGTDIPFAITNKAYETKDGREEVYWERAFHFPKKTRYFNATMSYDRKVAIIKDYLGDPAPLYSDLQLTVQDDGSIQIDSIKQKLVIGKLEIPLPKWLYGVARVKESYDDEQERYVISVHVHNKIIGTVFAYEGVFHIHD